MVKSADAKSSPLKSQPITASSGFKLRWELFKRRYANLTGVKRIVVRLFMYLLIIGLAFVFVYPFLYMISTSLMSNSDLNSSSVRWLPTELKFENFVIASSIMDGMRYARNSLLVTVVATFGHIITCSFVGYGFARYNFPFKKLLFVFVILAFIVPIQTLIIPMYITYARLKWLDTYLPLLIPPFLGFGLKGALYIFLFRQFFLTVPRSLEEAARIDGCGFMKTYWKIVFPLAKATIVVAMVLSVVWHWNDFYEPGLYISSTRNSFLPSRLSTIISAANALPDEQAELMSQLGMADGEDTLTNATVMAGALIICAPVLIFFGFAQRGFMQGIERTGITGE